MSRIVGDSIEKLGAISIGYKSCSFTICKLDKICFFLFFGYGMLRIIFVWDADGMGGRVMRASAGDTFSMVMILGGEV